MTAAVAHLPLLAALMLLPLGVIPPAKPVRLVVHTTEPPAPRPPQLPGWPLASFDYSQRPA